MNDQLPLIYTMQEFADRLGIKPKSVKRSVARGSLPRPDGHFGRTPYWSYTTVEDTVDRRKS